ncbi:dephospho-CoA kinase [Phanerochaete sordida]|uniref:Dephospho-CoA kinase n=1 Tax=Phanerochaete sordida TaxID=48140 RepID=A0A9P3G2F5_9APHY|nr:dephospho-CoA kinase [Phanerochaete sordida]
MLVVGLTGGIATGKSTVSTQLQSFGLPVVDADLIARQVVEPGTPALAKIAKHFGEDILQHDGTLDRQKLGAIVFNDEAQRKELNKIVHPAVWRAIAWEVASHWLKGKKICILDVPLLIEGGMWKWVAKVVVVYCSPELQLQRLMKRDGSSTEAASARLNAQLSITEKVQYADHIVDNSGSIQDLEEQVDILVRKLHSETGWFWKLSWFPPIGIISAFWTLFWRHVRLARRAARKKR